VIVLQRLAEDIWPCKLRPN